ncbi:50S ribosomal protein L9 [Phragmitibacter flavus]|uniref:Large ribosomal subunit protein bL9 n=1 Tax=Phragmitibacter flavus TaxID=2576071 RepID=A0A5R8K933_9BACT|nr:50S ribosomal protein L9 [Phragmitibacter flavus]TLD68800.1 50S ribosomal protein L9 [Phragmitibacter flavus]
MATVDIILKEKIATLGAEGDVVKVRGGYAHNFLVPQGKAFLANKRNLKQLDELQKVRAEREAQELAEAEKFATKLKRLKLKLTLATGQGGKAFGSITTSDIAKAVADSTAGIQLDRHQIELEKPIKTTGVFEVPVKLHGDINCFLKITVTAGDGAEGDSEDDS